MDGRTFETHFIRSTQKSRAKMCEVNSTSESTSVSSCGAACETQTLRWLSQHVLLTITQS